MPDGLRAQWAALASGRRRPGTAPATPGSVPAADGSLVVPDPVEWTARGGPAVALGAAAAALPVGRDEDRGSYEVTWHRPPPKDPARLTLDTERDPSRCRVSAGDRLLLTVTAQPSADTDRPARQAARFPREFRPLAHTGVTRLSGTDLDALARGDVAAVLGEAFDQRHLAPELLPEPWPDRLLAGVDSIEPRGGPGRQGLLTATTRPVPDGADWTTLHAAAGEVLRVHAFFLGMHLCLPGAHAVPLPDAAARIDVLRPPGRGPLGLTVEVVAVGMVPRPYVTADCEVITVSGDVVARLRDIGIAVYGRPEEDPLLHLEQPNCRLSSAAGGPTLFNELHMAHSSEGNARQFAAACGSTATVHEVRPRLPRGDFLMIDRGVRFESGRAGGGAVGVTEYDMPHHPWYSRENGTGTVPVLAVMEIALQPGGLLSGIAHGVALRYPEQGYVCRNLEGRARLLDDTDPRGRTVTQRLTVESAAKLPGADVHRYAFELATADGPFWTGEAVHGYFTQEVLDLQQGMDNGRRVPPWLDRQPVPPAGTRAVDARGDARLGTGRLALLEDLTLVPDGGEHGAGYVRCAKPVRPDDWYFDQHFFHDPVMPGSAGVQMLVQAVQAYALYTGLTDGLPAPALLPAVGEELRWSYRGQILRHHREVLGEIHLREVRRTDGQLFLRADGSVWRDGLRIYHVENIALATRRKAVPR
ncbi:3-hydroxyacyl-ACP dehydratase [Streptomyces gamaensis]|uniref:3-hydroxyacyl-ACP dehydratase n=1 Tax=Streptomyces gamaensis TaxID=1763542 RepID=A0ABW0Z755_9ACTN